jgi:pyrimidine-nucleoside phosphorylase
MRMYDIILKKRNGGELAKEEIDFFISNYTNGKIPDYQASALLMAIYFKKMNKRETADLTLSMVSSGEKLDLSSIRGIKVDKHSTGGVGDKTSLVLGPMVAACGVPVAKMSGRGLGHTGGTIDKLESLKGFSVEMTRDQFIHNVNTVGLAIGGQTGNLTPADKKLYALRDVTATVDNISLIASSIMSKKIAAGADAIVLDVKMGNGAFMKSRDEAFELAKEMVDIGTALNRKTVAVVSDMDQPLGMAVGNSLEVKEAIETLKGRGPADLLELCITLGSFMLVLAGKAADRTAAREMLAETITSGKAFEKFKEFVKNQGGDISFAEDPSLLPSTKYEYKITAETAGYVERILAEDVGLSSLLLGAGRETKESSVDLSVGILLNKKVGDKVTIGETLATVYGNDKYKIDASILKLKNAFSICKTPVSPRQLIFGFVTGNEIEECASNGNI